MLSKSLNRFMSISLRGATLISKFALIFLLAKFLEPAEVGLYGLLTVTISYVLMAIGFDFYTYATREIINSEPSKWMGLIRDQAVFYIITYAILLPLTLLIFFYGILPLSLIFWFFPLLALEHLAQEFNRLLVAIGEPLWASVILFLRQGLWAIVAAGWMYLMPDQRDLNFVLFAWAMGVFLACALAGVRILKFDQSSLKAKINWDWIKKGVKVAIPFVLATLALRALYTVDRFWIEEFHGLEVLAAYVLFMGIANVILTFLDAAVFTFVYPSLISAAGKRDSFVFKRQMKILKNQTILTAVILVVIVFVFAHPLIRWINKPIYYENFNLLYFAVLAATLSVLSMIPHYALYALKLDRSIIFSHLLSFPIFCFSLYFLPGSLGVITVPLALAIAFFLMLVIKTASFHYKKPDWLRA